jgi:hypothetical protein
MEFVQPARQQDVWLRRRWLQLWTLVLIPPAALALSSMSATMAAAALVGCLFVASATVLAMTADTIRAAPSRLPDAVRFAVCAVVTCLGFGGLLAHAGPLAWAVIAAYCTTAAWAVLTRSLPLEEAAVAPHEPGNQEGATEVAEVVTAEEIQSMTDVELCLAWRRSFVMLSSTPNSSRRAGVVSLRQAILDEMELRNPAGLQAWLHSGPRAAGGPDRFLGRSDETRPRKAA